MRELQGFLDELGRRVRQAREKAGLGVGETARAAGVSRRYLTETEAGRANPSALVLARLAETLRVGLGELLDIPLAPSTERVALIGLRGAGKSSVGRWLARRLEVPFVELDQAVEERAGMPLAEIFDLHGAETFHRYEAEALEDVLARGERLVLAAGGSIVDSAKTYERLLATCRTVWLQARAEDHFQRVLDQGDGRPMRDRPRAMEELRELLARRSPEYARCGWALDTHGRSIGEVGAEILEAVRPGG